VFGFSVQAKSFAFFRILIGKFGRDPRRGSACQRSRAGSMNAPEHLEEKLALATEARE
jgi:hypothetical protein